MNYPGDPPFRSFFESLGPVRDVVSGQPPVDPGAGDKDLRVKLSRNIPYVYAGVAGGVVQGGESDGEEVFAVLLEHRDNEGDRKKFLLSREGLEALVRQGELVLKNVKGGT